MERRRLSIFLIILGLLALPALAQQNTMPELGKSGMLIPWSDFKLLLEDLKIQPTPTPSPQPPVDQAFTTCRIRAEVDPKAEKMQLEMSYGVDILRSDRWVEIHVAPAGLALDSVQMDGSPARLYLRNGYSCTAVKGLGRHQFVLRTVVGISQSQGRWSVDLSYPTAPAASLDLRIPMPDLVFELSPGISLKTERKPGTTRLQAALGGQGRSRISWFKKIEEDQRETTLIAESTTALEIGEGSFRGTTKVNYRIHGRGARHFEIEIPEKLSILDISGQGLKTWKAGVAKDGRIPVAIDLDFMARTNWNFQMSFEGLLSDDSADFEIPDILVRGARREKGFIAVTAASNVEITPQGAVKNLALVDPSEMPPSLEATAGSEVLYVFKYLRHPIEGQLEVLKHRDLEVKRTIVERARLLSFVNAQGRRLHSATYTVRNNRKQFLSVKLPRGAKLWGAFRENQPIKASRREDGAILVPMKKTSLSRQGQLTPFDIRLVYAERGVLRSGPGRLSFEAPSIDVDILDLDWELFLPQDHRYLGFGGNLEKRPQPQPQPTRNSAAPMVRTVPIPDPSPIIGSRKEKTYTLKEDTIHSQVAQQNIWNTTVSGAEARGMLPVDIKIPREGERLAFGGKLLAPEDRADISFFYLPVDWRLPHPGAGMLWALAFLLSLALGLCLILSRPLLWSLGAAILLILLFFLASAHHPAYFFGIISGALLSLVIRWMRSRENTAGEGF